MYSDAPEEQKLNLRLEKVTEYIEYIFRGFGVGIYIRVAIYLPELGAKTTTGTPMMGMTGICHFLQEQI